MKEIIAGLAAAAAASSNAHETWLLPTDFSASAGSSVEFNMTSGMGFPELASGIDPSRLSEAVLMSGEERRSLVPTAAREGALVLSGIPEQGLACAWVHLQPRILEIPEVESVEHYLEEIGAPQSVWQAMEASTEVWRESYSKLARTYIKVGTEGSDTRCIDEISEARFDILPLGDPSALAPGDTLELQVLFDGEPLAGQAIGFVREGSEPETLIRSDTAGRATVTVQGVGRHMIYATNLRTADGAVFNWESDFTTLTFRVAE